MCTRAFALFRMALPAKYSFKNVGPDHGSRLVAANFARTTCASSPRQHAIRACIVVHYLQLIDPASRDRAIECRPITRNLRPPLAVIKPDDAEQQNQTDP